MAHGRDEVLLLASQRDLAQAESIDEIDAAAKDRDECRGDPIQEVRTRSGRQSPDTEQQLHALKLRAAWLG